MDLTKRQAGLALGILLALFALRMSANVGATLRSVDEAHYAAVAARLVAEGGPLYGNALAPAGPVAYWLAAAVFRVAGLYHMAALRVTAAAWWAATALAVYAAARAMMRRAASLAAAAAFLLAAANPDFQDLRIETWASLPIAAAVGLCARGVRRREATSLLLAGVAAAVAFLTRQQSGPLVGALAALPLIAWGWGLRRRPRAAAEGFRAACGSALILAGFAATVAGVWLWFAARGAGHAFVYCVWAFNWSYLRHCSPAGGYLPTPRYLAERVARFLAGEPLLPLALVGAVVGLAWRGAKEAEESVPWRARAAFLTLLLGVMWVVASPADTRWILPQSYVSYVAFLYVPMSLLAGVCVEVACRASDRTEGTKGTEGTSSAGGCGARSLGAWSPPRRLLVAALLGLGLAYVALPAADPADSAAFGFSVYAQVLGLGRMALAAAAIALAGGLLGGRRLAWLAPLVCAAVYAGAPFSLGSRGAHLPAAVGTVALGILWQARKRGSLILAVAAGVAHAAGLCVNWSPQLGMALGAAVWLLLQDGVPRRDRCALAGAYFAPVALLGGAMVSLLPNGAGRSLSPGIALALWVGLLTAWLRSWRLGGTLALCGALMAALPARRLREGWRRLVGDRLGLLLLAGLGALAAGSAPSFEPESLAGAGMATVLAAALAVDGLLARRSRSTAAPTGAGARLLLASACVVPALAALALAANGPAALSADRPQAHLASEIEPGSRAYVWGGHFESETYVRARAIPAAPQLFSWMLDGTGPPALGTGLYSRPGVATLDALDRHLSGRPPRFVVLRDEPTPTPADLPRFGPILRTRYRVAARTAESTLYRLAEP